MTRSRLVFVFCVEAGPLEPKARLLAESIRQWGGSLSGTPIFAYQPRGGEGLSSRTRACFEELDVQHRAGQFNTEHSDNPWANKIHACAHLAARTDAEIIAFFDTDTVI